MSCTAERSKREERRDRLVVERSSRQASQRGPILIVLWMAALACFRYGMTHESFLQQPPQLSHTEIAITPNAAIAYLSEGLKVKVGREWGRV
jgi:hypothetical protein